MTAKQSIKTDVTRLMEFQTGIEPRTVEFLQAVLFNFGFRAVATINTSASPNVRIWRILDGAQIIFDENAVDAIFSPDGRTVATINLPGTPNVRIWRISNGQEIIFDENAVEVVFSPDSRSVATINAPGTPNVRIWRISDGQEIILDDNAVRVVFNRPPTVELVPFPSPPQKLAPV
jgi:ribosomal protein L14